MKSATDLRDSRSQRIIYALKQLRQFQPAQTREVAIHVLSGVVVEALPDPDHQDHGLLRLGFGHGHSEAVMGGAYLKLQIIEHCRLEHDSGEGQGDVADRVRAQVQRLGDLFAPE
ncbi:MAG: hypothetical protein JOY84_18800 [Curvibacter sp.]|nr:hypothetical protein [Curvibacter sp.]